MEAQVMSERGRLSPEKRNPSPFLLRQSPNPFCVIPCCCRRDVMMVPPEPSPKTPFVGIGEPGQCIGWLCLHAKARRELERKGLWGVCSCDVGLRKPDLHQRQPRLWGASEGTTAPDEGSLDLGDSARSAEAAGSAFGGAGARRGGGRCGSHDHWLYALDYVKQCCVYKISCGGSLYGSPSVDMAQDMIYIGSTGGRVTAISLKSSPYRVAWLYEFNTPIFGSLCLDSLTGNVICCLVDGRVIALNSKGSIVWEAVTGGPVFAGACMSFALPSQVLVCSRNGSVYSFESESGTLVWEYEAGDPITSSAYIDEHVQLISQPSHTIYRLVCICCSSGSIRAVRIKPDAVQQRRQHVLEATGNTIVEEVARMDLPGDIFSSPVMVGGLIFVGCRDDHVRCLNIMPDEL